MTYAESALTVPRRARNKKIKIPSNIHVITDLHKLFSALQMYVSHPFRRDGSDSTDEPEGNMRESCDEYYEYFEIGRQVKVRWSKEEIGDTGWRAGWYSAEVQESNLSLDKITIIYVSEPESIYKVEVTPLLANGKLKLS